MPRPEIVSQLFDLHKALFPFAIQTARGRTQIPLFSIQAPGHIGIDSIDIPNLNLEFATMPDELKANLKKILSEGTLKHDFPMERMALKPGLVECFLNGFRNAHLLSVVSNPLNHYQAFQSYAEQHSNCIAEWLDNGTTQRSMQVIIQPNINLGTFNTFGQWASQPKTMVDMCIEGLSGFQSGQEAAERVFSSSFFTRDMQTMPASPEELLAEVDILVLSFWLSLGNIYRIQDVRFYRGPWQFSPDESSPLGIKFQMLWDNSRENLQLQTFARLNKNRHHFFAQSEPLPKEYYDKILRWMTILAANRKAIYGLDMICDGFRDIARSVGEQSFRKNKIARDGIYKAISGLEGLNTDCKPLHPKYGYKTKATETFIDCWSRIWANALSIDPSNTILFKSPDVNLALKSIYNLRSDLAHSDPSSMSASLMQAKQSCGDLFNPNQYDPSSVGLTILMVRAGLAKLDSGISDKAAL